MAFLINNREREGVEEADDRRSVFQRKALVVDGALQEPVSGYGVRPLQWMRRTESSIPGLKSETITKSGG